jgi:tetratricopeptide (TPR) repeat protein
MVPFLFSIFSGCGPHRRGDFGHLERADELGRSGKYAEAIQEYRAHMEFRLSVKNRPEWENPYFYLLLIGDIQLGGGDVAAAEKSYLEARDKEVDPYLISDRMRGIARWHEERGDLKAALQVLERYRELDPLLYDSMLDRIARTLTAKEDAERARQELIVGDTAPPAVGS